MAELEHTQNTRQKARQRLPEPFALARIRVQRCRPRRFDQTFTGSSPQHSRKKRLQPLSRSPIACARRVGAPCIVSDLQKLQQSSNSFDFRKRRYPCRRYRRVPKRHSATLTKIEHSRIYANWRRQITTHTHTHTHIGAHGPGTVLREATGSTLLGTRNKYGDRR
jgi:hypothetical protein